MIEDPYETIMLDLELLRGLLRPRSDAGETLVGPDGDDRPAYRVLDDVIALLGGDPRPR